jgi:hypothetical protein
MRQRTTAEVCLDAGRAALQRLVAVRGVVQTACLQVMHDFLLRLTLNLRRRGLPVVCLDARHAKAALSLQINKTDANDAFGLAQIVRTGWYREVAVKSMDAHTLKILLVARALLVSQRQATANTIRGLLKTFGLVIARGAKGLFSVRVREQIAGNNVLVAIIEPLLVVWHAVREQVAMFDRQILARARTDAAARHLMTIPGVGVVVALAYTAVIDGRNPGNVGQYRLIPPLPDRRCSCCAGQVGPAMLAFSIAVMILGEQGYNVQELSTAARHGFDIVAIFKFSPAFSLQISYSIKSPRR